MESDSEEVGHGKNGCINMLVEHADVHSIRLLQPVYIRMYRTYHISSYIRKQ